MAVDPNIKKKADDIRNKVYGREVRESLASGLEEMSSDVVENEGRQSVVEGRQDSVESQWQAVVDETTNLDVVSAPEIIAARDGEANLKARLDKEKNEVTAQLAQKANQTDVTKNVQGQSLKRKPIVVFTFDDGYIEDLTVMEPLFKEFGFNATTYIIAGRFGGIENSYPLMTLEQIKEIESKGWEIGSHTVNHLNLGDLPHEQAKYEIIEAKKILTEAGLKVSNFAYPFGGRNNYVRALVTDHYRTSTRFRGLPDLNIPPIDKGETRRVAMGSHFEAPNDEFPITNTFNDFYKKQIDNAVEENGLLVFALHSAPLLKESGQLDELRMTLEYCRDNNISVMTMEEALDYYDNRIDLKNYNSDYGVVSDFIIDSENEIHSTDYRFAKLEDIDEVTNSTEPSFYPNKQMTIYDVHHEGTEKGFPANSGTLMVIKPTVHGDIVRQFFLTKWDNNVYYRSGKPGDLWTDWLNVTKPEIAYRRDDYKPFSDSGGIDIEPFTQKVIVVESAMPTGINWRSNIIVNPASVLPEGITFYARTSTTTISLVIYNASDKTVRLSQNTTFNLKSYFPEKAPHL